MRTIRVDPLETGPAPCPPVNLLLRCFVLFRCCCCDAVQEGGITHASPTATRQAVRMYIVDSPHELHIHMQSRESRLYSGNAVVVSRDAAAARVPRKHQRLMIRVDLNRRCFRSAHGQQRAPHAQWFRHHRRGNVVRRQVGGRPRLANAPNGAVGATLDERAPSVRRGVHPQAQLRTRGWRRNQRP
jgi:hypothetical protein